MHISGPWAGANISYKNIASMAARHPTFGSGASRSISLSVSRSCTPSIGPVISPLETAPSKCEILIETLDFDRALTMLDQGVGICVYYQCYQAVLAAQAKFTKLHRAGKWDTPFVPTQNDFIALVTSRTMWYNEYKKNFKQAEYYPEMALKILSGTYQHRNLAF